MVRHIYLLLLVSVTALGFSPSAWAREEEGFGVGWLWIPVVIGLVWFMNHMYERHRSSELRNVARGNTPSSILRSNFKLAGEKGKIGNLLRGVRDNVEIEVFSYEVSAGENTTTTTIVAFRSASLELPRFELYPKGTFGMVATAFGALVVDFAWRPGFSDQFVLKGDSHGFSVCTTKGECWGKRPIAYLLRKWLPS